MGKAAAAPSATRALLRQRASPGPPTARGAATRGAACSTTRSAQRITVSPCFWGCRAARGRAGLTRLHAAAGHAVGQPRTLVYAGMLRQRTPAHAAAERAASKGALGHPGGPSGAAVRSALAPTPTRCAAPGRVRTAARARRPAPSAARPARLDAPLTRAQPWRGCCAQADAAALCCVATASARGNGDAACCAGRSEADVAALRAEVAALRRELASCASAPRAEPPGHAAHSSLRTLVQLPPPEFPPYAQPAAPPRPRRPDSPPRGALSGAPVRHPRTRVQP